MSTASDTEAYYPTNPNVAWTRSRLPPKHHLFCSDRSCITESPLRYLSSFLFSLLYIFP